MAEVDRYAVKTAASLKGVRGELRAVAQGVAGKARADLASHRRTGKAKITTSRGGIDYFANLDDEDAEAIEYGGVLPDGHVEVGLHIMRRAAGT